MIRPMLCRLMAEPFDRPGWRWERKWDGVRMIASVGRRGTELQARSGTVKTAQLPELQFELPDCVKHNATIDGEVVSASGLPFQEFAQRRVNRTGDVAAMALELPAKLMAFDLLALDGEHCAGLPLRRRRQLLQLSMPCSMNVGRLEVVSQYDSGVDAFARAVRYGWEGVVGKDMGQPYMFGKREWVKVKRWLEGEFWVIGFTAGTGKRAGLFGAMMLGEWDAETFEFRHVGDCGTGPDDAELSRLDGLRRELNMGLGDVAVKAHPNPGKMLKVRVKYVEVTNAGSLRFPVYMGLA